VTPITTPQTFPGLCQVADGFLEEQFRQQFGELVSKKPEIWPIYSDLYGEKC
jgi:hypothetical protein